MRADDPGFLAALIAADLPTDDLKSEPFSYFTAEDMAWGGVGEGADALLRSIVVRPEARGKGYGAAVSEALARHARDAAVARLWLLTTGAAPFFARLGWRQVERSSAPAAIAQSRQFSGRCPASAALMVRTL